MNELEKKKENKKKGFLAWLREKLGFSPKGMGNLSEGARDINLAGMRASVSRFGGGGPLGRGGLFGAGGGGTGGLLSFLGGKGAIFTIALVGLGVGMTLYYRSVDNSSDTAGYSSMGQVAVNSYVPRILKEQTNASSLDMFKKANKGAISFDKEETNKNREEKPKEEQPVVDGKNNQLEANLGFDNKPRLQTDMKFGLSSDIGSGSNKFSALGGFGNHMGKFGPQVGSGFNKLSPIKSQKRPIIAQGYKSQRVKGGKSAFDQAKAIKSMQLAPNHGKADTARFNLDKAWEGGTGGGGSVGLPNGGSGISDGGSGVVQTPSRVDDIGNTTNGINSNTNTNIPDVSGFKFDTPWKPLVHKALRYLLYAVGLIGLASLLIKIPSIYTKIAAYALLGLALVAALMVTGIGYQLMSQYGQNRLGWIYVIGGGVAAAGAIAALTGLGIASHMLVAKILAASSGVIALFAAMAQAPEIKKADKQESINKAMAAQQILPTLPKDVLDKMRQTLQENTSDQIHTENTSDEGHTETGSWSDEGNSETRSWTD